jgi:hypothetical protein
MCLDVLKGGKSISNFGSCNLRVAFEHFVAGVEPREDQASLFVAQAPCARWMSNADLPVWHKCLYTAGVLYGPPRTPFAAGKSIMCRFSGRISFRKQVFLL